MTAWLALLGYGSMKTTKVIAAVKISEVRIISTLSLECHKVGGVRGVPPCHRLVIVVDISSIGIGGSTWSSHRIRSKYRVGQTGVHEECITIVKGGHSRSIELRIGSPNDGIFRTAGVENCRETIVSGVTSIEGAIERRRFVKIERIREY